MRHQEYSSQDTGQLMSILTKFSFLPAVLTDCLYRKVAVFITAKKPDAQISSLHPDGHWTTSKIPEVIPLPPLTYETLFDFYCSDLYQNRLTCVFLKEEAITSRKNDLALKF